MKPYQQHNHEETTQKPPPKKPKKTKKHKNRSKKSKTRDSVEIEFYKSPLEYRLVKNSGLSESTSSGFSETNENVTFLRNFSMEGLIWCKYFLNDNNSGTTSFTTRIVKIEEQKTSKTTEIVQKTSTQYTAVL